MGYFEDRLKIGKYAEAVLDRYLIEQGLYVIEATPEQEMKGIDRIIDDGTASTTVEYKADFRAYDTGNIFLEHTKNDNGPGKPGWARTSEADLLIYYVPPLGKAYIFDMQLLKRNYADITRNLRKGKVLLNPGYTAQGYLLPLDTCMHVNSFLKEIKVPVYTEEELIYEFEYYMLH